MDEKEFKQRVSRLEQIAKVLEGLPSEARAAAFDLLKGYVTERDSEPADKKRSKDMGGDGEDSMEAFIGSFDHDKPADNAKLIAAYFYSEYGLEPFTLEDVRETAENVGIIIPARPDMTLTQAKEKGKKLFARAGKGKFRPTVHGEKYLKDTYSVKKGRKKRPQEVE